MFAVTGFEFCDSGLCEVLKAKEREKTWVSYERWGIVVSARSTNVQYPSSFFFGVASTLGNEIPRGHLNIGISGVWQGGDSNKFSDIGLDFF